MHRFHCFPFHHLRAALSIRDAHPEQHFHAPVEHPAGDATLASLRMVDPRPWNPAGSDYAIRVSRRASNGEVEKCLGWRRSIGVDVSDQLSHRGKFQAFDQGTSFSNWFRKLQVRNIEEA